MTSLKCSIVCSYNILQRRNHSGSSDWLHKIQEIVMRLEQRMFRDGVTRVLFFASQKIFSSISVPFNVPQGFQFKMFAYVCSFSSCWIPFIVFMLKGLTVVEGTLHFYSFYSYVNSWMVSKSCILIRMNI